MKIVDVAEFFSQRGGGVRSYLEEMLRQGERRGHTVVVVAPGPRDEVLELGRGRIIRLAGPPMPYDPTYHALVQTSAVHRILARERPDVVQASAPYAAAWLVARHREVPVLAHVMHSDQIATYAVPAADRLLPRPLRAPFVDALFAWPRALSRRFDVTIAPSRFLARELSSHGCERVRAEVFGIRRDQLGPSRRDPDLRARLLGPHANAPGAILLVAACRLAVEKGVARTIEAVRVLARRRPVALAILGEGPEKERLERRARDMPYVSFLGFSRDRAAYAATLASADAFVHGGAAETFCFVLGEALASGVPIVAPAAGAALDYLGTPASEAYARRASPAEVADAIERVLARDPAQRTASAVEAAARLPTADEHYDGLFRTYEELLASRAREGARSA